MSYLNYDGLAYFKSKLTNWVDQNYLSKTNTGNLTVAGHVTFTNPITGDLDGKAKKDWLGQKIDETYIKSIATNDNAGTIVYTKGNGSTNHILIDLLQGATPIANGRAGLVPAPTVSEMNYFLRGDGNWAVPTDVYVNQNLIASSNNNQFPVLLSGTSGTPATKTNATVGYTNVVSVNPLTNALMASQFISKHPTYNRQSTVTSKVQYSLNFTDVVSGAGHNLGEVVGYVDTPANGGEHELGFRLFGNPNVQGTEEDYIYMSVGLSKTNVAYGHAPSTPLPSAHNEPTDIITRDWLARNGSETGLVHTSMNETIDGTKTFVKKIVANDGMNATGNIATDTLTVRQGATVGTTLGVGGKATISGGLAVTSGTTTDTLTVTNGAIVSGGTTMNGGATVATGNLTVTSGGVTASNGTGTFKNLNVTSNGTFGGTVTANAANIGSGGLTVAGDTNLQNTTVKNLYVTSKIYDSNNNEYVQKVINDNRQTVINNLIKENGGLAQDSNHHIYVKIDNNTIANTSGTLGVNTSGLATSLSSDLIAPNGGLKLVNNKLAVKTGNGITVNSNGQVALDFDLNGEGGIVYDEDNHTLYIDFEEFKKNNEDAFNDMISGMINAQQISSNGGKNHFYVDGTNGYDTITFKSHLNTTAELNNVNTSNLQVGDYYTIGESKAVRIWNGSSWVSASSSSRGIPAIPFKTIQECVNHITKIYKFNTTNAYINCQHINETTQLTLPSFDRTTATIVIRACTFDASTSRGGGTLVDPTNIPSSADTEAKIDNYLYPLKIYLQPESGNRHCIETNGTGVWSLYNFDLKFDDTLWRVSGGHQSPLHATDYSICKITTCKLSFVRAKNTFWTNLLTTGQHVIFASSYALCEINRYVKIKGTDYIADENYINGLFNVNNTGTALPTATSNLEVGYLYRVNTSNNDTPNYVHYFWNGSAFERFSNPFNRVLHGIQISDNAMVRVQDTRTLTNDDRAIYFYGAFRSLVNCSSILVRNLSYLGKVNVTNVTNTDYKLYIYAGGYVRVEDPGYSDDQNSANNLSGKLDYIASVSGSAITYTPRCEDTWLGRESENTEVINGSHSVRTSFVERATNSWYK